MGLIFLLLQRTTELDHESGPKRGVEAEVEPDQGFLLVLEELRDEISRS